MQTMPIQVNGEEYLSAGEAITYLGIARDTFYRTIKDKLRPYYSGIRRRAYYRKADLEALKTIRPGDDEQK